MVIGAGPILIGFVALVALIALIVTIIRPPRKGWKAALVALAIPLAIFAGLGVLRARAVAIPPIHDVATDTVTPPAFSGAVLKERAAADANPLNGYDVPLGTLDPWKGDRFSAIANKTIGEIVRENYGTLNPISLGDISVTTALDAAAKAMREMGFEQIRIDRQTSSVEGVAETFWYGFKDDVVVRVANGKIDFRSVSSVGLSDLGANAARIGKLRTLVAANLPG